jgi:hypothetical protein
LHRHCIGTSANYARRSNSVISHYKSEMGQIQIEFKAHSLPFQSTDLV